MYLLYLDIKILSLQQRLGFISEQKLDSRGNEVAEKKAQIQKNMKEKVNKYAYLMEK